MRLVAATLLLALLGGCAGPVPVPEDRFYRLATPVPARHLSKPITAKPLIVRPLEAEGLYAERAVIYSEDPGHRVLRQYHYHFWLEAPGRLLQDYVAAYLRAAGLAPQVSAEYSSSAADYVVSGRVLRFERLLDGDQARVVVALRLSLRPAEGEGPLLVREYRAEVPAAEELSTSVPAFERALDSILAKFVQDAAMAIPGTGRSAAR